MITDAAQESAPEQGVLVTSRPLDEYCALFGLTRARLAALPGPVLDCPVGAAALAAEARALGCRVIAADQAYALPLPEVMPGAGAAGGGARGSGLGRGGGLLGDRGGLGLGLFIAKTLLERSGAAVVFENRGSSETGARVTIVWPRALMDDKRNR